MGQPVIGVVGVEGGGPGTVETGLEVVGGLDVVGGPDVGGLVEVGGAAVTVAMPSMIAPIAIVMGEGPVCQ